MLSENKETIEQLRKLEAKERNQAEEQVKEKDEDGIVFVGRDGQEQLDRPDVRRGNRKELSRGRL